MKKGWRDDAVEAYGNVGGHHGFPGEVRAPRSRFLPTHMSLLSNKFRIIILLPLKLRNTPNPSLSDTASTSGRVAIGVSCQKVASAAKRARPTFICDRRISLHWQ